MMTVVGYPESDPYNKIPKYCSFCGRELTPVSINHGTGRKYDPFTGKRLANKLICPVRSPVHDEWRMEEHGAWVNYAYGRDTE